MLGFVTAGFMLWDLRMVASFGISMRRLFRRLRDGSSRTIMESLSRLGLSSLFLHLVPVMRNLASLAPKAWLRGLWISSKFFMFLTYQHKLARDDKTHWNQVYEDVW